MDRRDEQLLDRQMSRITPPPGHDYGLLSLAAIAVFLAGMTLGGLLFDHRDVFAQTAANNPATDIVLPMVPGPITR